VSRRYLIGAGLLAVLGAGAALVTARHARIMRNRPYELTGASFAEFTSLEPIDAHTHIFTKLA
jgi:hypothetical protein